MKVVLLAGGLGTRISEESYLKPKPMIEIGGKPIIWHIMKIYTMYGYNEFIICCGYKADVVKEYFVNYYLYNSDVTLDFTNGNLINIHKNLTEPWKITLVDTGLNTMTSGRIRRIQKYTDDEAFMLTYGDGVADIDINKLVEFHKQNSRIATITAVKPEGRFGALDIQGDIIESFREKEKLDSHWINGGFMVFEPSVFDYIDDESIPFEKGALTALAEAGELSAYKHYGFWQCMDTQRDKQHLEELLQSDNAYWKKW